LIKLVGAKGNIQDIDLFLKEIQKISEEYSIVIQAMDADWIYVKNHLISAINHAKRAFEQKKNSTNSFAMEILLYASGDRQIQKAIKKIGVKKGSVRVAFIFTNKEKYEIEQKISEEVIEKVLTIFDLERDDKVLEGDSNTLKKFGITKKELNTLPESKYGDIILEKVAMVDVIK
jgi:KEOPS complex subunit Cgi121